jgi:hypothetical protein
LNKSFYIFNPHRDDFIWEPLYFNFIKRRALKKYNYIANVFTENENVKLLVYDKCSGLFPQSLMNLLPKVFRRVLLHWEIKRWLVINNLPVNTTYAWLDNRLQVLPDDEVFMFQLSNEKHIAAIKNNLEKFKNVYVHLSHYYLDPKRISNTFSALRNTVFCGDSDVSNHPFFKRYFPWYNTTFKIVTFYIADRFKNNKPLEKRLDKVITTGTFHPIEDYPNSLYLKKELDVNAFHYNRRNIYEQKETLKDIITCYNSPWKQKDASWIKKLWNASKVAQKSYFQMDIVEEYNSYKYALIGEEICGFPGIGTFEAMACGCIVLVNKNTIVGLPLRETEFKNFAHTELLNLKPEDYKVVLNETVSKPNDFVKNNLSLLKCKSLFIENFSL